MPDIEGRPDTPTCPHTESPFNDMAAAVARLENGQALLAAALTQVSAQIADLDRRISNAEREAEDILRRAAVPAVPPPRPVRRQGARWLRSVQVALIAVLGLGVALALAPGGGAPVHRAVRVLPARGGSWSVYGAPGRGQRGP